MLRAIALMLAGTTGMGVAHAQSLLHLDERFEGGLHGWTATGQWHHAAAGECGAPTGLAAYNLGPASCDCGSNGSSSGVLRSPTFTLVNAPYTITFDHALSMDPDDLAIVRAVRVSDGAVFPVGSLSTNVAPLSHVSTLFSDASWIGEAAYLEFEFQANNTGDVGFGWLLDNVQVRSGSWTDLGLAKTGSQGAPLLLGTGPLNSHFLDQLSLFDAHPSTTAILIAGLSRIDAPFKGGTLVPQPHTLVVRTTNAVGINHLSFLFPAAAPPDLALYFQYWIQDPTASGGWSASNALLGLSQ